MKHSFVSKSPEDTFRLGKALGKVLQAKDFIGLIGTLGAGKTQFIRGVAAGAEVPSHEVSSPTFAIVYTYEGRIRIHHADLYRLEDEDELYATGFDDLLAESAATLVEWIDKVPVAAPLDGLTLRFDRIDDFTRRIDVSASGPHSAALLQRWIDVS